MSVSGDVITLNFQEDELYSEMANSRLLTIEFYTHRNQKQKKITSDFYVDALLFELLFPAMLLFVFYRLYRLCIMPRM